MDARQKREVWFDGRAVSLERHDVWGMVNNSQINKVVVTVQQHKEGRFPRRTGLVTEIRNEEDFNSVSPGETVLSERQGLLDTAKTLGYRTCLFCTVEGSESLEESWQNADKYDYAVLDFDLPTNIPLELVIARLQESKTVLLKKVNTFYEAEVAFGILERGSDGVLFAGTDMAEIQQISDYLSRNSISRLELTPLVVTEVRYAGMGARACVDTTSLMTREEGMLVGSTSSGGVLVCSETHFLPYMNLRPFRVNAGAVHSYIWAPNNATEYITDLAVGSKVLCVNTRGVAREVCVGRVKIEVRPLLIIKGEAAGTDLNVIVQDDWHIRVMGADAAPKNATTVRPGDELLAYVCEPGRHVGIKIEETIIEK